MLDTLISEIEAMKLEMMVIGSEDEGSFQPANSQILYWRQQITKMNMVLLKVREIQLDNKLKEMMAD